MFKAYIKKQIEIRDVPFLITLLHDLQFPVDHVSFFSAIHIS